MANLRTAMDAAFWDLDVSTPQAIDGVARAIPGDPILLDGSRASRVLRYQQFSLIGNGFPLGIIPSFSPSPDHKELGSIALQSLIGKADFGKWWVGLIGQFRPKKLISSIKAEFSASEEWDLPLFKETAKHFVDKSLFALGLCSQLALSSSSSLLFITEKHGEKKKRRNKAMLFHKLPDHDITLEAAWPELFIDHKGKYWEVPESISLDCSSLVSESGLRYRFGIHKNSGHPMAAVRSISTETPVALLPGLCAKAAFSYEKSKDFWRKKETKEDVMKEAEEGQVFRPTYDVRLKDPHSAISGIIGGTCEAWFGGEKRSKNIGRLGADLFGSLCYTLQHGRFRNMYGDLTRIDARVDIASATAILKRASNAFRSAQSKQPSSELSSPRLNLIFQQQIVGPIVFRIDSKFRVDSSSGKVRPELEDLIYSLNYSLRLLISGKVVAWFSPKRKEGMIELRIFEF